MVKRLSILLPALLVLALVPAGVEAGEPAITPRPLHVIDAPGAGVTIGDGTRIVVASGGRDANEIARYLGDLTRRSGGVRLVPSAASAANAPAVRLIVRPGFAAEGYSLEVDATGVSIAASTRAGLLYGSVSLWQLLDGAPGHRLAPMHIDDAPRFRWRGLLLDSVRHMQSPAMIARMIDWMALHKLNRLQWHLADDQGWRFAVPGYPRLASVAAWRATPPAAGLAPGRYGGVYARATIRRLVALAASRNVTIVPEIEMPGHATAAILAYPEVGLTNLTRANLADWGVFPSIYGVGQPTFAMLHAALDEVMALFPSREIAIGGDEAVHTLWRQSPAVQAKLRALGLKDEDALQGWFVGQIGSYLNAHGRRLVGWDEILSDKTLATGDIVLSWHGADGAIAAARAGHDVVMATAPTLYFDHRQSNAVSEPPGQGPVLSIEDVYRFDPGNPPHAADTPAMDAAAAAHVLGVQGQLWAEHIVSDGQMEAMALPRAAAVAESGWTAAGRRDFADFGRRLPAWYARYRALGLNADDGAVAIQPKLTKSGDRIQVSLQRQVALGDIRYTVDGKAPTITSPRYGGPFEMSLPGRLRAAGFTGVQRLPGAIDLTLDTASATRRASQQLDTCSNKVPINLPGRDTALGGKGPAYLVNVLEPCWIYRDADLAGARHIAAGVAALPFNYQFASDPVPPAVSPLADLPTLTVRRGSCSGPVIASVALSAQPRDGREATVAAPLSPQTGRSDLCLAIARPMANPLWALGWVELRP